ncbi:hypothetical protein HMPREF0281_00873 [Corynebacterium ammoniagenes DSM 20306]|uniref:Uncharacterized protein n=1 Tax=Corynebacterium ammoniagenes DSM 20306 TaxID=649754 RepID=A0ABN0AGP7_CORAM|nr:hypothetical protein HMPREF0281_00873 [Corynebacterium ammoniagenes DSM 20306]
MVINHRHSELLYFSQDLKPVKLLRLRTSASTTELVGVPD